ncbi:MAG: S53 family serine peptidase [Kofleriaceae bacterium]
MAPPSDQLRGLFSFKLRDRDALEASITAMYTPASPTFRQYMSVEQFMELHGPLEEDVQVVRQFLSDSGLTVARVAENRMLLQITGTVAEFNTAFDVELHKFVKSDDVDYFQYGTDSDLILIRDIAERIGAILVLDPAADTSQLSTETGSITTDPPPDVDSMTIAREAKAYGLDPMYGANLRGQGSTIGVVAGATFRFKDLQSFWQGQGITRDDPERVMTMEPPATRFIETTVDIEWAGGMAPGAKVIAYEAPDAHDTSVVYAFNAAIADARADVITDSFAHREDSQPNVIRLFYNDSARMAAALGITVVAAGGDSAEPDVPSACPFVTAVGGTVILLDDTGALVSERAWVLSGSGDSLIFGTPPWQLGTPGIGIKRAVVDVALNAGTAHWSYVFGDWGAFGGTSFSTPVFAGLIAVINGKRRGEGRPPVGFLNQTLYSDPDVQATFRDITAGGTSFHDAAPGWDYPTGWGAPDAAALADALP